MTRSIAILLPSTMKFVNYLRKIYQQLGDLPNSWSNVTKWLTWLLSFSQHLFRGKYLLRDVIWMFLFGSISLAQMVFYNLYARIMEA